MKNLIALLFVFALCDLSTEATKAEAQSCGSSTANEALANHCDLTLRRSFTLDATLSTVSLQPIFRDAIITLTTTGTSGAATYNNATGALNIPQYAPAAASITNNPSVTIQTVAAAANGNQLSASRNCLVHYSVTLVSTATIAGSQSGYVALEICPTNSSTAGDWIEIARVPNGQAVSLAVVLQSVSTGGGQVSGIVPAGYYRRLRSVNVSGTPSYSYNSGQEIQL